MYRAFFCIKKNSMNVSFFVHRKKRNRVLAITIPDPMVQKPLELVCGKSLERFGDAG
jgi:hypothetical protein